MVHDPIGPGTPAWEAAERAIRAIREQRAPTSARNALAYMSRELRMAGATWEVVEQWYESVRRMANDPTYTLGDD